jgi:hypothetical protein
VGAFSFFAPDSTLFEGFSSEIRAFTPPIGVGVPRGGGVSEEMQNPVASHGWQTASYSWQLLFRHDFVNLAYPY